MSHPSSPEMPSLGLAVSTAATTTLTTKRECTTPTTPPPPQLTASNCINDSIDEDLSNNNSLHHLHHSNHVRNRSVSPSEIINNNNNSSSSSSNSSNNGESSTNINSNNNNNNNNNASAVGQQFCLRWNNFKSNLQQTFERLLEEQLFVDVTIACDERSVKCHRIVLSACSPYFASILKEADCSHPVIILQGVKWCELRAVVDFMYKGEINVSQDQLPGLIRVAETLKVRGLTEVGDGEEAEAVITASPSPRSRLSLASGLEDDQPRKRRRYSGDEVTSLLHHHHHHQHHQNNLHHHQHNQNTNNSLHHSNHSNNRSRSRTPSPDPGTPMAMDFLDTTLEPILSQANLSRSSASSQSSLSTVNGLPHSASPTASLASSLSTLAAHLPSAMPPPGHHIGPLPPHLTHLPPLSPLSPLLNMHHPAVIARAHQQQDDFEIRPGIAEMIREEERVRMQEARQRLELLHPMHPLSPEQLLEAKRRRELPDMAKLLESTHHWMGTSMAETYQAQVQAAWQKSWNQTQSLLQNLRFRERGPLKSWRPETMADAIHAVLKEGLSLSQAARKYDIPYPTFVLYANRVHNLLGPSTEPGDLRPKGRGRPQRILLGSWPEEQIKVVIRAVVFRDTTVFKDHEHKARMVRKESKQNAAAKQHIKVEDPGCNAAGGGPVSSNGPTLAALGHMGSFKPSTPIPMNTPDGGRSSSTPSTSAQGLPLPSPLGIHGAPPSRSHGPSPLGQPLMGLVPLGVKPLFCHGQNPLGGESTNNQDCSGRDGVGDGGGVPTSSSMQQSPQQSPAVSTPLPLPLSSPATPDTAVSLPPPSPSIVTPSPVGGTIPTTSDSPPAMSADASPPRLSPSNASPPRRSPITQMGIPNFKGMHPHGTNGPMINGTSPNTNGPMMTPTPLPFPQHLLQQQVMGSLMQGALPPNMPPPPNHTRMPHMPPSPYPGYMRPPVPPHVMPQRVMGHESPEAMLFNKIVGSGQFPPMNPRPFFQQGTPPGQVQRSPAMLFHLDPSLDTIKSEPEPIVN